MSGPDRPSRLRLFRDGRFVDEPSPGAPAPPVQPPGTPQAAAGPTAPLLAPGSAASAVLGYGCLLVVLVPLLLATLFFAFWTAAALLDEGTTATEAVVTSVAPGSDAAGPRPFCYEVRYEVEGTTRTHRTCDVTPEGAAATSGEALSAREARFAAEHPVGSTVQVLRAVDPPHAARGAVADPDVTLLGGGTPSALIGVVGMLATAGPAALVVRFAVRSLRRGRPSPGATAP